MIAKGLKHQRVKKQLELILVVATKRLFQCQCRAYQKTKKQQEYIQSNKCLVEQSKEREVVQVQGYSTNKQKPIYIEIYKKGKGIRVIVSIAFQGNRERSNLLILECDFESKKYRYSTNSYLALLKDLIILNYTNDLIFIQDNTLIYIAKKVKEQFKEQGI